jgi:hypothetical protein
MLELFPRSLVGQLVKKASQVLTLDGRGTEICTSFVNSRSKSNKGVGIKRIPAAAGIFRPKKYHKR